MDARTLRRAHRCAIASACGYLFLLLSFIMPKIVMFLTMPVALISNLLLLLLYRRFKAERTSNL